MSSWNKEKDGKLMELYRDPLVEMDDMMQILNESKSEISRRAFDLGVKRPPIMYRGIVRRRMAEVGMLVKVER